MENEIKINTIGQLLDYVETEEKANQLIDYITNLQEENERLKKIAEEHKNCTRKHWQQKCFEHYINEKLLQSRIDKAVEYLEQQPVIEINGEYRNIYAEDDNKLLNILNGGEQ